MAEATVEDTRIPGPSQLGGWNADLEQLLRDWRTRAYAAQAAHYASADMLRRGHWALGIPTVIGSTIVGTAIFDAWQKEAPTSYALGYVSIVAAVLAAIQTLFRFAERAAAHAAAADWYSAIRRDIEAILSMPVELRGNPKERVDEVRKEMNRAAQDAPELSVRRWQNEAKRFGVREPFLPG